MIDKKKIRAFIVALLAVATTGVTASACSLDSLFPTESVESNVEETSSEEISSEEESSKEEEGVYTIQFVNEDGSVLQSGEIEEGKVPTYVGETPTKAATAEYTYTFSGWDKEIVAANEDATYTAQFTAVKNQYTVIFKNEDGTVLVTMENVEYGATVAYPETIALPEKAADNVGSYTFKGWDKELASVTGNVEYTAVFETAYNEFSVKFMDGETVISEKTDHHYGDALIAPEYTKNNDAQYTYTFVGWKLEGTEDSAIVAIDETVSQNRVYVAVYTKEINKYDVEFYSGKEIIYLAEQVPYGEVPQYVGETPVKYGFGVWEFKGWDKEFAPVDGENLAYHAQFDKSYGYKIVSVVDGEPTDTSAVYWEGYNTTVNMPLVDITGAMTYRFTVEDVDFTAYDTVTLPIAVNYVGMKITSINGVKMASTPKEEVVKISVDKEGNVYVGDSLIEGAKMENGVFSFDITRGEGDTYASLCYGALEFNSFTIPEPKVYVKAANQAISSNANFTITDVSSSYEKATGFDQAYKVDVASWTNGNAASVDLTVYSEVKFAIKSGDSGKFYSILFGGTKVGLTEWGNNNTDWLIVSLVKNGDVWDVYFDGTLMQAGVTLGDNLSASNVQVEVATYYVSEVKGVEIPGAVKEYATIADRAVAANGNFTFTDVSNSNAPAVGFDTTTQIDVKSWTNGTLASVDLSLYTELKFAIKTGNSSNFYGIVFNQETIGITEWGNNNTDWLTVSLVKNGDAWDMYFDGALKKAGLALGDTLASINAQFSAATYYVSELKGIQDPAKIKNYVSLGAAFTHSGEDVSGTETALSGFETVTQLSTSWNKYSFNSVDLTGYSEVRIAVKSTGYYGLMSDGSTVISETTNGGGWLTISLVKNGANWDVYYDATLMKSLTLANNNLTDLYFRFGTGTYYVTELQGVAL